VKGDQLTFEDFFFGSNKDQFAKQAMTVQIVSNENFLCTFEGIFCWFSAGEHCPESEPSRVTR
jgi:hypothetical protein